jgi:UDP-N-acetylglucosamine--N-acetylmuramyl-(pentapeptide) pyrophosphoryl-undecaprenol N-acetylglucosamine transferase
MKTVLLACGKTGGPLMPLIAICDNLSEIKPVIVGIKDGFEYSFSQQESIEFERVLDSRLSILSFHNMNFQNLFLELLNTLKSFIFLILNVLISVRIILRRKPSMIISAGGFSAVGLVFANNVLSIFGLSRAKVVVHQQDPDIGITHKLISRFASVQSCVFESTKKISSFKNAIIIPNPSRAQKNQENPNTEQMKELESIRSGKPILLIYAGGSGSLFINNWVVANLEKLLESFVVIHLIGQLQENPEKIIQKKQTDYYPYKSLQKEMNFILKKADLVVSRAGLGSISELLELKKNAYLVPLPNSHQESNAKEMRDYFEILQQYDSENWLNKIQQNAKIFNRKKRFDSKLKQSQYDEYIRRLQNIIENEN